MGPPGVVSCAEFQECSKRPTRLLRDNGRWRCFMGDKGKKDKEKGLKQHAAKDRQEDKKKLERQPKRTA